MEEKRFWTPPDLESKTTARVITPKKPRIMPQPIPESVKKAIAEFNAPKAPAPVVVPKVVAPVVAPKAPAPVVAPPVSVVVAPPPPLPPKEVFVPFVIEKDPVTPPKTSTKAVSEVHSAPKKHRK
ncbi:MAG: hypothetical protein WC824_14375 [Bacteroidota bacterium]|jgi:hypothetical protein